VKLGGGFYCAKLAKEGGEPIYVFNGFFMSMRTKFTTPGTSIHYYVVEWDPKVLSWADFRGSFLGPTDPAQAPAGSLRGQIMAGWQDLGLQTVPNVTDNGVHASASPYEAMAERMNWLASPFEKDPFAAAALEAGVSAEYLKAGTVDPQVPLLNGSMGSLFDALEDLDTPACLERLAALCSAASNQAFVFIKPHANTSKTKELVNMAFQTQGIKILSEGELTGEAIDKDKLIDQHYYAIASKATILKPHELPVPADKFAAKFGIEWQAALDSGKAYNAIDACAALGIEPSGLDTLWKAAGKENLVKLGGGFYCAKLAKEGGEPIYVFNGFFMSMRTKFTTPGTSIHYYVVEWDPKVLSWADFRGSFLGPTDPAQAPAGSLRGQIMAGWQDLGLQTVPNVTDNGVHASASPYEAMAERMNWLASPFEKDPFAAAALEAGVSAEYLKAGTVDPQVPLLNGSMGSLFDALEDLDTPACLERLAALCSASK